MKTKDLQSIEEKFLQNPSRALITVVEIWLQQQYNVQRHGPPTWQMLVKAIDSPAGGNDHTLARKIASKHPAGEYMYTCSLNFTFTHSTFWISAGNLIPSKQEAYEGEHSSSGGVNLCGIISTVVLNCNRFSSSSMHYTTIQQEVVGTTVPVVLTSATGHFDSVSLCIL